MEDDQGMIPMEGPDDILSENDSDTPPTVKMRNAAQQEVSRLLDILAPERSAARLGNKKGDVERHRTPRGCVVQAPTGAVTISWFPDSAQGAELGELQVVAWSGIVSRPGSSSARSLGAKVIEELVLRPAEMRAGGLAWRDAGGATYTTDSLAAHCENLLEQFTNSPGADA